MKTISVPLLLICCWAASCVKDHTGAVFGETDSADDCKHAETKLKDSSTGCNVAFNSNGRLISPNSSATSWWRPMLLSGLLTVVCGVLFQRYVCRRRKLFGSSHQTGRNNMGTTDNDTNDRQAVAPSVQEASIVSGDVETEPASGQQVPQDDDSILIHDVSDNPRLALLDSGLCPGCVVRFNAGDNCPKKTPCCLSTLCLQCLFDFYLETGNGEGILNCPICYEAMPTTRNDLADLPNDERIPLSLLFQLFDSDTLSAPETPMTSPPSEPANPGRSMSSISRENNRPAECTICAEIFDPLEHRPKKTLCCLTTLCLECLLRIYDEGDFYWGERLECPFCRELVAASRSDLEQYPDDERIVNAMFEPLG